MDGRKIVCRETGVILIGECISVAIMLAVYALLGRLDASVLLGGLIGGALAVLNFFFMAASASLAADRAAGQDITSGKKLLEISYGLRLIVLFVILFACAKSGLCSPLASILPLAFVRPVITIAELFRKRGA